MPPISRQKKDKISEQILHHLFSVSPEPKFTAEIAQEIARDEEFTKQLLEELQKNSLITEVTKNKIGSDYIRRRRWRLSNKAFEAYSKSQSANNNIYNFNIF